MENKEGKDATSLKREARGRSVFLQSTVQAAAEPLSRPLSKVDPERLGPTPDHTSSSVFAQRPLGLKVKPCHPKPSCGEGETQRPSVHGPYAPGCAHQPAPVPTSPPPPVASPARPRNNVDEKPVDAAGRAQHPEWKGNEDSSPPTTPCNPPGRLSHRTPNTSRLMGSQRSPGIH